MDGSNMISLVMENVGWPNGITIDYVTETVYWVDARYDYIDSIDYNGKQRRNVAKGLLFVPHPFAITVFGDYIYFTDWVKRGIVRISKTKGIKDYKVIVGNLSRPMDMQVISSHRQPDAPNPCAHRRHRCQQMCGYKIIQYFSVFV